jgi:hypothetical protein
MSDSKNKSIESRIVADDEISKGIPAGELSSQVSEHAHGPSVSVSHPKCSLTIRALIALVQCKQK